jgi:hypothetical protein
VPALADAVRAAQVAFNVKNLWKLTSEDEVAQLLYEVQHKPESSNSCLMLQMENAAMAASLDLASYRKHKRKVQNGEQRALDPKIAPSVTMVLRLANIIMRMRDGSEPEKLARDVVQCAVRMRSAQCACQGASPSKMLPMMLRQDVCKCVRGACLRSRSQI